MEDEYAFKVREFQRLLIIFCFFDLNITEER